jgi:hypothetical protein
MSLISGNVNVLWADKPECKNPFWTEETILPLKCAALLDETVSTELGL